MSKALADEARLMAQIQEAGLPAPTWRGMTEWGEVLMTWSRGGGNGFDVSLSLEGDGMYGAAMRRGGTFKGCVKDGDLNEPLNEELATFLRKLKSR